MTRIVTFARQSYDKKGGDGSAFLQGTLQDIEEVLLCDPTFLSRAYQRILPAVCHYLDVDIAQNITCGKEILSEGYQFSTDEVESAPSFNDVIWGSSRSYASPVKCCRHLSMEKIAQQISIFAECHFQSAAKVTSMNQLELGCLALWLSWYPYLFKDNKNSASSEGGSGKSDRWQWSLYKENVVTGLLNILSSQKHDPKCLSVAVACLSYLIEQHTASGSVLTDANISQLLRLCLSKSVYPTVDNVTSSSENILLPPHWEITFCRIGVRRFLHIPQVLASESAVNEAFTFASKWWERLKGAASGPGSGFETPGKIVHPPNNQEGPVHPPIIPVVRSALEILSDLYELVQQIQSYVQHMVCTDSLLFLTNYIESADPRTVILAVKFVSSIISDLSSIESDSRNTGQSSGISSSSGPSPSRAESKLNISDLEGIYMSALRQISLYCTLVRPNSKHSTCSSAGSDENENGQPGLTQTNRMDTRNVLHDLTNISTDSDARTHTHSTSKNLKSKSTLRACDSKRKSGIYLTSKTGQTVVDVSQQARNVLYIPLIASLSGLVRTCLLAADALQENDRNKFFCFALPLSLPPSLLPSMSSGGGVGVSKNDVDAGSTANTNTANIGLSERVEKSVRALMMSLRLILADLIVITSKFRQSVNIEDGEMNSSTEFHEKEESEGDGEIDGGIRTGRNGDEGVFSGLIWRRQKAAFNLIQCISMLHQNCQFWAIKKKDIGDAELVERSSNLVGKEPCFTLYDFEDLIKTFSSSFSAGMDPESLAIVLISVIKWGGIKENQIELKSELLSRGLSGLISQQRDREECAHDFGNVDGGEQNLNKSQLSHLILIIANLHGRKSEENKVQDMSQIDKIEITKISNRSNTKNELPSNFSQGQDRQRISQSFSSSVSSPSSPIRLRSKSKKLKEVTEDICDIKNKENKNNNTHENDNYKVINNININQISKAMNNGDKGDSGVCAQKENEKGVNFSSDSVSTYESQPSCLLTLACLGSSTNATSNTTFNISPAQDMNTTDNSVDKKRVPNQTPLKTLCKYDSTRPYATPRAYPSVEDSMSLSKAFTPAHSRSRRMRILGQNSEEDSDNSSEKMSTMIPYDGNEEDEEGEGEEVEEELNGMDSVRDRERERGRERERDIESDSEQFNEMSISSPIRNDLNSEDRGLEDSRSAVEDTETTFYGESEQYIDMAGNRENEMKGRNNDEEKKVEGQGEGYEEKLNFKEDSGMSECVNMSVDHSTNTAPPSLFDQPVVSCDNSNPIQDSNPSLHSVGSTNIPHPHPIQESNPSLQSTIALTLNQTLASASALRRTLSSNINTNTNSNSTSTATVNAAQSCTLSTSSSSSTLPCPLPLSLPSSLVQATVITDSRTSQQTSDIKSTPHSYNNILLSSDLIALQSELQGVRTENVQLKVVRDSLILEKATIQASVDFSHAHNAGLGNRIIKLEGENRSLVSTAEDLRCELEGVQIIVKELQSRKLEQEELLQEIVVYRGGSRLNVDLEQKRSLALVLCKLKLDAWQRLSVLAKREAATQLLNAQLTAQASSSKNRAAQDAVDCCVMKGIADQRSAVIESLESQLRKCNETAQSTETVNNRMQDYINQKDRECDSLTSQLNIVKDGFQAESVFLLQSKNREELLERDLEKCQYELSALREEKEEQDDECENLKSDLDECRSSLLESEEALLSAQQSTAEWQEKCENMERTYSTAVEEYQERIDSLSELFEVHRKRGDEAESELQKHRDLISYINKLSTEGEAGRAKARRLSEEVTGVKNSRGKGDGDDRETDMETHQHSGVGDNSGTGERSRKVRKPSSKA